MSPVSTSIASFDVGASERRVDNPMIASDTIPQRLHKAIRRDRFLLLLVVPAVVYYVVFHYLPMYGVIIAFKQFSPAKGILASPWVGLKYFEQFFGSVYFGRVVRNTVLLSAYTLLFGFPVPIVFALILNELRRPGFKRVVQTISYLPHFISVVIVVGMVVNLFAMRGGIVNNVIEYFGGERINFLMDPRYFRSLYVGSEIWQTFGWNSIIYFAALAGIDADLYEAARIDGASRVRQMWHVSLPGLLPVTMILLIIALGNLMSVGFQKILLLYNPSTYSVADVIATYTYRRGILNFEYSFGAAVGLFNGVINMAVLLAMNKISRAVSQISLF